MADKWIGQPHPSSDRSIRVDIHGAGEVVSHTEAIHPVSSTEELTDRGDARRPSSMRRADQWPPWFGSGMDG